MAVGNQKRITEMMVNDTARARIMPDMDSVLAAVRAVWPEAHREGSAGGWSWDIDDHVVAASCAVLRPPHSRHWLAIRPRPTPPPREEALPGEPGRLP